MEENLENSLEIIVSTCKEVDLVREIAVKYTLSDEDEQRLRKITELYKQKGLDFSEDNMFESIMLTGSKYDVDKKFRFHEWKLGLRENFLEE